MPTKGSGDPSYKATLGALMGIHGAKVKARGVHLEALHQAEGIIAVALGLRSSPYKRARLAHAKRASARARRQKKTAS